MGRKQKLKRQRKIEEKNKFIIKKAKNKKLKISIIFLVLILFAAWQFDIAWNRSKSVDKEETKIAKSVEKVDENVTKDKNVAVEDKTIASDKNVDEKNKEESLKEKNNEDNETITNQEKKIAMIETNKGNIKLELFTQDAPKTVENFVKLANENFYDGIKFHRVISDFMIQAGDPISKGEYGKDYVHEGDKNSESLPIVGTGGPGYTFEDEFNSHKVVVGSLAMANSGPNTNGSQFFIVTERDQPSLDGKYTVFGKVLEGMDVVTSIEQGDVMNKVYIIK